MMTSFGAMMWLGVSSQIAKSRGLGHNQLKSLSTENCPAVNFTSNAASGMFAEKLFFFFIENSFLFFKEAMIY